MLRIGKWWNLMLCVGLLWGCGKSNTSPELEQAASVVRYLSSPKQLSRSAYAAAFAEGNGAPSKYVSYLFSTMGSAEWPRAVDNNEAQAMRSAGIPILPDNVALVPLTPKQGVGRKWQLVVRFDNARGVIIVDGYGDPTQNPLFTQEWPLPQVAPAPGVQETFESQVETGVPYQSF